MYLSVNNPDKSTSILSFKEIIGLVFVFSFVLYLIFPKENIDKLIESKSKNRNLSINYLESMLLYYPDSLKIKRILIEHYEYIGKLKKALTLNRELLKIVKDREELKRLYQSEYFLLKNLYFQNSNKDKLKELKDKLYKYFNFTKGDIDYTFFFAESTQMDFTKLKYISLKGFLKERPELVNYDFEKDAFTQALSLGYKEESYYYLLHLLEYIEFEETLYEYALGLLIQHKNYAQAKDLATRIFLSREGKDEKIKYFNTALYLTIKSSSDIKQDVSELISLYQNSIELKSFDIVFILKSLLEVGDVKGSAEFALKAFKNYPNEFDSNVMKMAVQSLTYDKQLSSALKLSLYAKNKFKTIEWLDKSIQLSLWQGKMQDVVNLNIEGYKLYKNRKYEQYLLNSSTLNTAYGILGEIYRRNVENRDYTNVNKLVEYYEYTGEIDKGEEYFTTLLKKAPHKQIHKEAILFSYKNSHYKKGLVLYKTFKKKYGIDIELQNISVDKLITLRRYKEAYAYAKSLKEDRRLLDLAWLQKDYKFLYKKFWKAEKENRLAFNNYSYLLKLEKSLNKGEKLPYLYEKLWKKTKKGVYLTALLYKYLEKEDLKAISKLLATLSPKEREHFEQNIQYHIVLANYYIKSKDVKSAMSEYKKALAINSKNASTHQAYLWFMLDNELTKPLKKELFLLEKSPKLQREVGFPSVITALKFQKSNLALRWLKPLLKSSDNIEYQVVYADLLELQDRGEGAKKIRLKLFAKLNRMVKKEPRLLKDKEFARVYLGLVIRYKTPYKKRAIYFKKFKSLFSKKDFLEMKIGWYSYKKNPMIVTYLAKKSKLNIPWLNLYMAINLGDNQSKKKLLKEHIEVLPFRDVVMASIDIGDIAGAYSLAFSGLQNNSRDVELFKIYNDMVNRDYPKSGLSYSYKHVTPQVSAFKTVVSSKLNIYKGIESKASFSYLDYKRDVAKDREDSSLEMALKNRNSNFLWNFSIASHNTKDNFISASLDIKYLSNSMEFGLKGNYQNRTNQTSQLEITGLENSMQLTFAKSLTPRIRTSLSYKNSSYKKQNSDYVGKSQQFQLSADYLLRAGYPDIKFNGHITYNRYDEVVNNLLPKDFTEFGTQVSIGGASKGLIQRSWRPFATVGLALNNHNDLGTSLSFGASGSLKGADSLSLMFDYSKGIDAIAKPYYGFHLGYRF